MKLNSILPAMFYESPVLELEPIFLNAYNTISIGLFNKVNTMQVRERIIIDPKIQHGKPVIRGTRVPVTRVISGLAGGMTREEIIREYDITEEDVAAALIYAVDLVEAEEYHSLPVS